MFCPGADKSSMRRSRDTFESYADVGEYTQHRFLQASLGWLFFDPERHVQFRGESGQRLVAEIDYNEFRKLDVWEAVDFVRNFRGAHS